MTVARKGRTKQRRTKREARLEASIRSCYATWSQRYYADYYASDTMYPPVHLDIVRGLLDRFQVSTVIDAGCGPASMLRNLDRPGLQRWGFDLTAEMVDEARRILKGQGVEPDRLWVGSVLEPDAYRAPGGGPEQFDAALCFGVLPHIPASDDLRVLKNLHGAVKPGGLVAVEARNELFALFTLNRYSQSFFRNTLIRETELLAATGETAAPQLQSALDALDRHFRTDLPPLRSGYSGEPGYDEVLSRTHNPFVLREQAHQAGLVNTQILFYHFHALPPMFEEKMPELFRRASLALEDPTDWRGHFMASAFVLVGERPR